MSLLQKSSWTTLALASGVFAGFNIPPVKTTGTIADIEHVVLFMQENRAFDHYFGTMAGVRGFKDPNAQINANNTPVWYQKVNSQLSNDTDYLLPWDLTYLGGNWSEATECMVAGNNGWQSNHHALNNGTNDLWAIGNTPWSWGHFSRKELPNHFAIAEGFTVADMYQESVISSTNPNRVTWLSGTINAPGSPPSPDQGGFYIDNNENVGCEGPHLNCYPLSWATAPEYYQNAGVSWMLYQDTDNFDDNPLYWFQQYQDAPVDSPLAQRGMEYVGLEKFYADAAAGTLPQISIIVGPAELSEHPPYTPRDGAWLQQRIVDAVTQSPAYKSTVLIISYDESGGWGDHVTPFTSPRGTVGEWVDDPYNEYGYIPTGPGVRLPAYLISPWTRGGHVYTEHADHNSQLLFIEKWLTAKGYNNITTREMNQWRRDNMADLTRAFDFAHPDYSIPNMPNISYPSTDSSGNWNGQAVCEATYAVRRPPVPYGKQDITTALKTEQGFKQVRGMLTEGRFLTFEYQGKALANANGALIAQPSTDKHDVKAQRFVLHEAGSQFSISSAVDGSTINGLRMQQASAWATPQLYTIVDLGNGKGYTLQSNGQYLVIENGCVELTSVAPTTGFSIFSVTYDN